MELNERYEKLAIRVQKIGIVDLFLTACLFAEIVPKSMHLFKDYMIQLYREHYAASKAQRNLKSPHLNPDYDLEYDNSVYREPVGKVHLTFCWVFKEALFVAAVLLIFVAGLDLVKATSLVSDI